MALEQLNQMALLVDARFNAGLPANLTPNPGVNSGFKGMQLSVTSLTCAIRQMAGPSSIHTLPTEEYNQDVVSLGMHSAVTAMDALESEARRIRAVAAMPGRERECHSRAQATEGHARFKCHCD